MTARSHPPRVAVIGGGLAGLAAAWHLDAAGFACRVFESGKRPGGPALSKREGACLFEYTPSVLQLDAALLAWLEQLGLGPALHPATPYASRRWVLHQGTYQPWLESPLNWLLSRRVDRSSKRRRLVESLSLLRPGAVQPGGSVAAFVRAHLGDWFNDYLVAPWLALQYGVDAEQADMALTLPDLIQPASRLALARQLQARLLGVGGYGLRQGLDTLTDTLSARVDVRLGQHVGALIRRPRGWCVVTGMETYEADLLVLAVSTREAALLLAPGFAQTAARLGEVRYAPMIDVHSVYHRENMAFRLRAGGAWHPQCERPFALGVEFISSQISHRTPDGEVLVCARLGGMAQAERLGLDDAVLGLLLDSELDGLLGVLNDPLERHIHRRRHAYPHPDAALAAARAELPTLAQARVLVAADWAAGLGPEAVLRHAMTLPAAARAALAAPA